MPNDLQELMDTVIMPGALPVLREACSMPALINRDVSATPVEQFGTVRVPLPQNMGAAQDVNTSTGTTSTDLDDLKVDVKLDKWKYKQFEMTDKEAQEVAVSGVLPSAMSDSVRSLAEAMNLDIMALYKEVPYFFGTAGTTPSDADAIANVRKVLSRNKVANADRRLVLDPDAEAKFLVAFKDADKTGTTETLRNAALGRLYGFDTFADQSIPVHAAGSQGGQTGLAVNGAVAAGATTMNADGAHAATATLKAGDVFTVANVKGQFVVTADRTAATSAFTGITFSPAAPVGGFADNAAITVAGSHTANLAFHRDFATLAIRPLAEEARSESSTISIATDPVSGIPLRLETWRDPWKKKRIWCFDVLYGVKLLRAELAARLLG